MVILLATFCGYAFDEEGEVLGGELEGEPDGFSVLVFCCYVIDVQNLIAYLESCCGSSSLIISIIL